jgi:hypothetical protein
MNFVAHSAPDGHTLTVATNDGILIIPRLKKDLPYDVEKDFEPITQMVYTTTILVTAPKSPFDDFREMVAYAKANPGKLNLGSFGVGGGVHQLLEMINKRAGVRIVHVPYKGSGPAVQAAVAGEVDLAASTPQVVGPFIRGAKLKGLAITTDARNPDFPGIKTYREQGYDIPRGGWFGLFAPGRTPVTPSPSVFPARYPRSSLPGAEKFSPPLSAPSRSATRRRNFYAFSGRGAARGRNGGPAEGGRLQGRVRGLMRRKEGRTKGGAAPSNLGPR